MRLSLANVLFGLLFVYHGVAAKQQLMQAIDMCKRNDPDISECFCSRFNKAANLFKQDALDINVVSIDPFQIEHFKLDFTNSASVKLNFELINLSLHGLNTLQLHSCNGFISDHGLQFFDELHIPELNLSAQYKAKGNILLLSIDAAGNFSGAFSGMVLKSIWNSTRYMKDDKEYLTFTSNWHEMSIEKVGLRMSNAFGNNTKMNDQLNELIEENIHLIYDELKPIVLEEVIKLALTLANDFFATFTYNQLFPV